MADDEGAGEHQQPAGGSDAIQREGSPLGIHAANQVVDGTSLPEDQEQRGAGQRHIGAALHLLVRYAINEALSNEPGTASLCVRLAELLFPESLRGYVDTMRADTAGWLAGLRDPVLGKALRLMHEASGEQWSVDALAEEVACYRSFLAERFKTVVGEAPMH